MPQLPHWETLTSRNPLLLLGITCDGRWWEYLNFLTTHYMTWGPKKIYLEFTDALITMYIEKYPQDRDKSGSTRKMVNIE